MSSLRWPGAGALACCPFLQLVETLWSPRWRRHRTAYRPAGRERSGEVNEICVLGLGTMGGRVAAKLVENGHLVRGFDPSTTALRAAAAAGVKTCDDPADAVARARA